MFKKILIPLDGSPLAELALSHLSLLPSPDEVEVVLVQVIDLYKYAMGTDSATAVNAVEHMKQGAKDYLKEQCNSLQEKGFQVSSHVREGGTTYAILSVAKEVDADLIVMTSHGRSGVARWALGSVAEQVVHGADVPILLARGETNILTRDIQRILVPLDGSALAEQVLPTAQTIAKTVDASLLLLQVIPKLDATNKAILYDDEAKAEAADENRFFAADQYLHQKYQEMIDQGIRCEYKIRVDDPADEICDLVESEEIDLIVISTHGRSGVGRWVYGSVANKVLRHTNRPLLLMRSKEA